MHVVEFTRLPSLATQLAGLADDLLVLAVPRGSAVVSLAEARLAYEALDGDVVLAATAVAASPAISRPSTRRRTRRTAS